MSDPEYGIIFDLTKSANILLNRTQSLTVNLEIITKGHKWINLMIQQLPIIYLYFVEVKRDITVYKTLT